MIVFPRGDAEDDEEFLPGKADVTQTGNNMEVKKSQTFMDSLLYLK